MVQSVRKDIPTGSLVLLAKPNSAGESCVYLRYYLGKYVKRSTNVNVLVGDWDDKHQRLNASSKDSARINNILYTIKAEIDSKLINYDGPITYDILKKIVNDNQAQLHKDRNAKDRTFNTSLHTVSMTLRFKQMATMHSARHCFSVFVPISWTSIISAFEYAGLPSASKCCRINRKIINRVIHNVCFLSYFVANRGIISNFFLLLCCNN